jgi:hypothetical protein
MAPVVRGRVGTAAMTSTPVRALLFVAALAGPVVAQPNRPPPPPAPGQTPAVPPALDPLRPYLGPPDQPFRPFAPLGPPPDPLDDGIGTRYGILLLAGHYGIPGYGLMWIPAQPVAGQPTDLGLVRQELSLFAPIYREGCDTAAVGIGIRNTLFYTDAILPDSLRMFPSSLWNIEAGVAYSHQWDNGWTTGAVVSAGSASDRPFSQGNVLNASLALYTAFPTVGEDAWIAGVSYAPSSDFPYPLPIISYYWKPHADLEVNLGVPFFMRWRFAPEWTADLVYLPVRTVSANVTWSPCEYPEFHVYGAFNWSNESYFLADRRNDGDRFYGFEKRLTGGIQFDLPWRLRLDLSAGYVFDRFYFQGRRYADRNKDRVDVGAGWFLAAQLRLQF